MAMREDFIEQLLQDVQTFVAQNDGAFADVPADQLLTHPASEEVRRVIHLAYSQGVRDGADDQHHLQLRELASLAAGMEKRHREFQTKW